MSGGRVSSDPVSTQNARATIAVARPGSSWRASEMRSIMALTLEDRSASAALGSGAPGRERPASRNGVRRYRCVPKSSSTSATGGAFDANGARRGRRACRQVGTQAGDRRLRRRAPGRGCGGLGWTPWFTLAQCSTSHCAMSACNWRDSHKTFLLRGSDNARAGQPVMQPLPVRVQPLRAGP